jgi:hypothetical protein
MGANGRGFYEELELLVRSRYGLIVVDTFEEDRVEAMLRHIAFQLSLHFTTWSRVKGLRRGVAPGEGGAEGTTEPARALVQVEKEGAGVYHFPGLAPFLEDPVVSACVKEAAAQFVSRRGALVISGHDVHLPDVLRPHATVVRLPYPEADDFRSLIEQVARDHAAKMPLKIELSPQGRQRLIQNLSGLTLLEAEKVLTKLIMQDGRLDDRDIGGVVAAKRQVVEQHGLLEFHAAESGMGEIAGLRGLKGWLAKRRAIVGDPHGAAEFGLSFPKGVLLLGVPGCGKSLCAKAVAREWELPLLKLDAANLYSKYVGESEGNFKRAMRLAEGMSPAVLWIDELEKAFAGRGDEDGGVSRRVLGSFLSWMQDRRGDVFVVATSNDVTSLPPEFIRKGRFDELFFVDLPIPEVRLEIFRIHLRKRKQDPERLNLTALVSASDGFSGAEIEQAVVSAL